MRSNLILSLSACWFASTTLAACNNTCKAYPGTPSWPSRQTWSQLNETLQGRLIKPLPPAGVCHKEQPNYDEEQCATLAQDWATYQWHADDPVSTMWENWSNSTCLPDPEKPCSGDGYPAYVVNATSPADVKAGIDFGKTLDRHTKNFAKVTQLVKTTFGSLSRLVDMTSRAVPLLLVPYPFGCITWTTSSIMKINSSSRTARQSSRVTPSLAAAVPTCIACTARLTSMAPW